MTELLINFLISPAYADSAATPPGGATAQFIMLIAFGLIFYFLLWRPQSKRAKEHRKMVSELQRGDEVVTSGGILAKIAQVNDDHLVLKVSDNVDVRIQKHAVSVVLPKGTLQFGGRTNQGKKKSKDAQSRNENKSEEAVSE